MYPKESKFKLNEQEPHSLADFIRFSDNFTIFPIGLPEGITPQEAHDKLILMEHIQMKPLGYNLNYFWGWFQNGGNPIYSSDEKILFKIILTGKGFELHFQPDAISLLK